jgi:5-methylcytosine-specific restriction protein A
VFVRHSSSQLRQVRSFGGSIEDYTFVQPKGTAYDFTDEIQGPVNVVVVIEADRIYAVYEVKGVIEEGSSAALHSAGMRAYDAKNSRPDFMARRFDLVELSSAVKGKRIFGWERRQQTAVQRIDGGFFHEIRVDIDQEIPDSSDALLLMMRFERDQIYVRQTDIHAPFGGSRQSGISVSARVPAIFIFTGESGEEFGYADSWEEEGDVFIYVGEGQVGDMRYTGGNKALRDHVVNGLAVHLFESVGGPGGRCRYIDEMQCVRTQETRGPDRNAEQRVIIQFRLVRLSRIPDVVDGAAMPVDDATVPLAQLRERAYKDVDPQTLAAENRSARRQVLKRSQDVALYALRRAAGVCESCKQPAPFVRVNGQPYLEVHHTTRLADNGLDSPPHVAAICPTCHRHIHYGQEGGRRNDELRESVRLREDQLDQTLGARPFDNVP